MSNDWITIDVALEEFHTTGEQLSELIRNGDLEIGPSKVSGGRTLPQVSVSQLEERFHYKDTHRKRLKGLSQMAVGGAIGVAASELTGAFKSAFVESNDSNPVSSDGRNRTSSRERRLETEIARRLWGFINRHQDITEFRAGSRYRVLSDDDSDIAAILVELSLSFDELADLAQLESGALQSPSDVLSAEGDNYDRIFEALRERFIEIYQRDPVRMFRYDSTEGL